MFLLENTFTVDSTSIQSSDSLFVRSLDVVPLSNMEESAYANLDSTASLEKSFQPTGFLAKFVTMDEEDEGKKATADSSFVGQALSKVTRNMLVEARFNRVDALYTGLGVQRSFLKKDKFELKAVLGYSFGYEEWSPRIEGEWALDPEDQSNRIWAQFGNVTASRLHSTYYADLIQTVPILLGFDDYNDYYVTPTLNLDLLIV